MTATADGLATRRVASPHLRALESESIHILREVAGQCQEVRAQLATLHTLEAYETWAELDWRAVVATITRLDREHCPAKHPRP